MELKLSDEDKKEGTGGGLKLSGGVNLNNGSDDGNGSDNPWDFNGSDEPIKMRSITSTVPDSSSYSGNQMRDVPIILKISKVLLYVLFILNIASLAWICSQDMTMIYANLQKFQLLYSISEIYVIVDFILVSVMYEFKGSLLFIALIFGFLYPKKRNDHVDGNSGLGGWLGVVYFLAIVICLGTAMGALGKYGRIIMQDDETRTAAMEVLNQTTDQGESYEDIISGNCRIVEAYLEATDSQTVVVISGYGDVYLQNNEGVFVQTIDSKNIETHLGFVKSSTEGQYKLAVVELNGLQLDSYWTAAYWDAIQSD